jgi:hypothetical protein
MALVTGRAQERKIGVGVEWRFLESNRWLYKEICSGQDRPTSSVIEGVRSSSID